MDTKQDDLNAQHQHWENTYSAEANMFGEGPSYPARRALEVFLQEGKTHILEIGAGQGRDTLFFAENGLKVTALDYSGEGVEAIMRKAQSCGLSHSVAAWVHDIREALPFADDSFDACYSHMLYCMALTTPQLEGLSEEVRRVLKLDGINIYTARNTSDPDYGTGIHRGEDLYEVGGFIVHFFSREKVERLADGYEILRIEEFEEGELPKKLFLVALRKRLAGKSPVSEAKRPPEG